MNVNSKTEFLKFLEEEVKNSEHWENNDLKSFIEALKRYGEDIDGYYANTGQDVDTEKASWKLFADLIKGATIYE